MAISDLREQNSVLEAIVAHSSLTDDAVLVGDVAGVRDSISLSQAGVPLLLYGIDTNCVPCVSSFPVVDSLAQMLPCDARLVGVQMGRYTPADARKYDLSFPVVTNVNGGFWEVFPQRTTPWLILIGTQGTYGGTWRGAVTQERANAVGVRVRELCTRT